MVINYSEEAKRLNEYDPENSGEFWKPKPGQHKVVAISELEEAKPFEKEGEEPTPQSKIKLKLINEDNKEVTWTMGVGKTSASVYGQFCNLAENNNGKLEGLEFLIVVTNDGTRNSYALVKL